MNVCSQKLAFKELAFSIRLYLLDLKVRTTVVSSDYRSSNVAVSDSERECSAAVLGAPPAVDSESGGEHSRERSPRQAKKRQVPFRVMET